MLLTADCLLLTADCLLLALPFLGDRAALLPAVAAAALPPLLLRAAQCSVVVFAWALHPLRVASCMTFIEQALHPISDKQSRMRHTCRNTQPNAPPTQSNVAWSKSDRPTGQHTYVKHTHHFATGAAPIYKCVCDVATLLQVWAAPQKTFHRALHPSMLGRSFLSMFNNLIAMRPTSAPRAPAVLILVQKSATAG